LGGRDATALFCAFCFSLIPLREGGAQRLPFADLNESGILRK